MAFDAFAPADVRDVRHGVRHVVRHKSRAVIGMCGTCGTPRTRARACNVRNTHATTAMQTSHAHVDACRTSRTYRTTRVTARLWSVRHAFFYAAQPALKKIEEVTEMEKPVQAMTCGEDNQEAFRLAFREAMGDEGRAFAKALYDAGLISGLRGVRIGPVSGLQRPDEVAVRPTLSDAAESRLADAWWKRGQGGK